MVLIQSSLLLLLGGYYASPPLCPLALGEVGHCAPRDYHIIVLASPATTYAACYPLAHQRRHPVLLQVGSIGRHKLHDRVAQGLSLHLDARLHLLAQVLILLDIPQRHLVSCQKRLLLLIIHMVKSLFTLCGIVRR